jgi:hypothetical protein
MERKDRTIRMANMESRKAQKKRKQDRRKRRRKWWVGDTRSVYQAYQRLKGWLLEWEFWVVKLEDCPTNPI